VFPDWFGNNTQRWWQEGLQNWSDQGISFSGIWLDMNGALMFSVSVEKKSKHRYFGQSPARFAMVPGLWFILRINAKGKC
jgi:alpha-glucosidase (family GH31 glycosyl hydrolase)